MNYFGPNGDLDCGPCLDVELDDGVLSIAFNRPEQHNAISPGMALAMAQLLAVLSADEAVRVVVLRGKGSAFCGGLETSDTPSLRIAPSPEHNAYTRLLRRLPQPVMAMVHGQCHAGAIAIVESCDLVLCADDADFVLADSPRQSFDGQAAQRQGLVTFSVPASTLESHTYALARDLVSKDALALRFTKQTLQRVPDIPWDEVLGFTSAKQAELKALQAGRPSARASAIESFLAGKSKPGTGA